jgi:peptidoglycan/xylan/chitin deacetylase (PgdA/CDA1 family)
MMPLDAPTRPRNPNHIGRKISNLLFSGLYGTGLLDMLIYADPNQLTALSYHRIDDSLRAGFDTYKPNVSATPAGFKQQMEFLRRHYNVITCEQLALWLRGRYKLPPRSAIVSFDDGYSDNLVHAHPVLQALELPATIFVCTDIIETKTPFYWDRAAYCFSHTQKDSADLPLTGKASWVDDIGREKSMRQWILRVKQLPDTMRDEVLDSLASALDVSIPAGAFSRLYLNWDQVRELSRNGIEIGAHTASHPILTRIPLERVEAEVVRSKERIEAEIGKPVISFAYPNGLAADFSPDVAAVLRRVGIEVAFTLMPGPTRHRTIKQAPLAIRRIFVGAADTLPSFAAKLAGFARLIGR